MKRLAFWIIVGMVVINFASRRHSTAREEIRVMTHPNVTQVLLHYGDPDDDGNADSSIRITRGRQDRKYVRPARIPQTVRVVTPVPPQPPEPPQPPQWGDENAQPVPTTEPGVKKTPSWFPRDREQEVAAAKPDKSGKRVLVGSLSASPDEAVKSVRERVRREVFDWLAPDIAKIGEPSESELALVVRDTHIQPVLVDINKSDLSTGLTFGVGGASGVADNLYTIYRAGQVVDFSDAARAKIVSAYQRRVVHERLLKGGGVLAFGLLCLSALTGYIRTDEATRGNYRRRLGALTLAATAGAGVALYRWMA